MKWEQCRIGDVGEVQLGRQRSPEHHRGTHMRPYLRVANVFDNRIDLTDVMSMNFAPAEFERFRLRAGDILLNEGQSRHLVGRPAIFRGELADACFTNSLVRFRAGPRLVPNFALYVFRHYLYSGRFTAIAKWTTNIAHLGAERFADLTMPVPPIDVQRRIVAKLDELLTKCRAAREQLEAVPALVEQYRQSVLAAAFRGELTADWRKKNPNVEPASKLLERIRAERRSAWEAGELAKMKAKGKPPKEDRAEENVELPQEWRLQRLDAVCDPNRGIPYGIVQTGQAVEGGVPTVRCGDIKAFSINSATLKRVDVRIDAAYPRTRLQGGEVLLAIRGSVGEVAVAGRELAGANISREVAMIPAIPPMEPRFLMYFLKSPLAQTALLRHVKGVAQQGINLEDVRKLWVPMAPVDEQQVLVQIIDQLLLSADTVVEHALKGTNDLSGLERGLLAKAFEGGLIT